MALAQPALTAPKQQPLPALTPMDLARVPVLMLGDLFVASTSLLDPASLDINESGKQFLEGCRLGPPGSATLFINRKTAELAGSKIKLPEYAKDALQAVKDARQKGGRAAATVAPWRIQRVPMQVGFRLLQELPGSCRLAVPAEDLALSVQATTPAPKPAAKPPVPGQPKKEVAAAPAPPPPPPPAGRIPVFRMPGLTLRVRLQEEGSPLLVLSPTFLSPRALQAAIQLAVAGKQEMWKRLQKAKRRWIQEASDNLEREIRSVQGWVEHEVGAKETLASVAAQYKTTPQRLLKANGLDEATSASLSLPAGAVLQVMTDSDGEPRGVGAAVKAGMLGLQRGGLQALEGAHSSYDSWRLANNWGTGLKFPERYGMKAGFLEEYVRLLATLNATGAVSRSADGQVPDTKQMQEALAAGLNTYMATAFLFGGQELVDSGAAQLIAPEAPAPPALPAAPEAPDSPPAATSRGSKGAAAADSAPAAPQPSQQQQPPRPRPHLVLTPQQDATQTAVQLAAAVQVGAVVASHMVAVASLPPTPQLVQQKRIIGSMLTEKLGVSNPQFEMEGFGIQYDKEALEGKKGDDFLAPLGKTPAGTPAVVRGLLLVGDLALEELLGVAGIPLPSVQRGSLEGLTGVAVATSKLLPAVAAAAAKSAEKK